jgi:poly-gamma-glutamate synthesis protein (capsule biosynthesis protein)
MGRPFSWKYSLSSFIAFFQPSTDMRVPLLFEPPAFPVRSGPKGRVFHMILGGDIMTSRTGLVPRVAPKIREFLAGADLCIANCEGPVGPAKKDEKVFPWINFGMEETFLRSFLEELALSPFQCVLSVANNHMGDRGLRGLQATLANLGRMGVRAVGQMEGEKPPILCLEVNGFRLGFAAWTHWQNRRAFDDVPAVLRAREVLGWDWQAIKKEHRIDCLVGIPHWGYEFQHFPRPEERRLAESLLKNGFDILAGHHSHVLQPLEWLGENPCFYSLGNVNGPPFPFLSWPIRLGAFLEIALTADGSDRARVARFAVHPFFRRDIGGKECLSLLEEAPTPLRRKLQDRMNRLFPFPQAGLFRSTISR